MSHGILHWTFRFRCPVFWPSWCVAAVYGRISQRRLRSVRISRSGATRLQQADQHLAAFTRSVGHRWWPCPGGGTVPGGKRIVDSRFRCFQRRCDWHSKQHCEALHAAGRQRSQQRRCPGAGCGRRANADVPSYARCSPSEREFDVAVVRIRVSAAHSETAVCAVYYV